MSSIAEMQTQILLNILRELGTYPDTFTQDEKQANAAMCIMVKQLEIFTWNVQKEGGENMRDWWGENEPDYEEAILARQEMQEILEDEGILTTPDDYSEFDYPCGKTPDYYNCIKCKRWKITCDGGFGYD